MTKFKFLIIYCLLLVGAAAYLKTTLLLYALFLILTLVSVALNLQTSKMLISGALLALVVGICVLMTTLLSGSLEVGGFVIAFAGFMAAWSLSRDPATCYPPAVWALGTFVLAEFYLIAQNSFDPIALYLDERSGFSWNHVSIIHMFLTLIVIGAAPRASGWTGRAFIFIGLIFATFGLSRGGILAFFLIGLWSLFIATNKTMSKRTSIMVGAVIGVVVLSPLYIDTLLQFTNLYAFRFQNFTYGVRGEVVSEYLADISLPQILLGKDIGKIAIQELGNNPHNSLIRVHSMYGAAGLILTLGVLLRLVYFSNLIGVAIFLRILSESSLGGTPADFFVFLIFLFFGGLRATSIKTGANTGAKTGNNMGIKTGGDPDFFQHRPPPRPNQPSFNY